jgi:TetR/AcrR family transcriptional regulator
MAIKHKKNVSTAIRRHQPNGTGKSVRVRDSNGTKEKIGKAAVKEFTEKGYEGTTISMVARRAGVSKQLLCHHFPTKEDLFRAVHDLRFRRPVEVDSMPSHLADVMAERFRARAQDIDYVRFLTWEAASGRGSRIPGRDARLRRIIEKASAIRELQTLGRIPPDLDHRLLQLAITSLATYPLAFQQITVLITGRNPTDESFQKEWYHFLRKFGQLVFKEPSTKTRSRSR